LNALPTLGISAWIVRRAPLATGAIERCKLGRAYAPITPLLPRHDMEVEVRRFLPAKDPVVLERQDTERLKRLDKRLCDSLGRGHDRLAFLLRKIEQRSDMPTRDNTTLAHLELPGAYHGERVLAFFYDRPSLFATCHSFTEVAGISYGKFNQLSFSCPPANRTTHL
jgi:hypothetical protein